MHSEFAAIREKRGADIPYVVIADALKKQYAKLRITGKSFVIQTDVSEQIASTLSCDCTVHERITEATYMDCRHFQREVIERHLYFLREVAHGLSKNP